MKRAVIAAALLLSGCATFDGPVPARDEIYAHIRLVDDSTLPAGRMADSLCSNGRCDIRIRRSSYPYCITHEIRHGFEGTFHGNAPSDADCYVTR